MSRPLPIFEAFSVLRVPFPFTDRAVQRRRPAVMISGPNVQRGSSHVLLAMITTAMRSSWPLDWPIQDLASSGLRVPCCVRFKLFSLDERLILGQLGRLAAGDRSGVRANLQRLLQGDVGSGWPTFPAAQTQRFLHQKLDVSSIRVPTSAALAATPWPPATAPASLTASCAPAWPPPARW
jgi:mRNA interferase MazF